MNLVSINEITKTMGNKTLFEKISFGIESGEKIALIGTNGCGKSTLMKIIAGFEKADEGDVIKNRDTVTGYLEQIVDYEPENTILDHIFDVKNPLASLIKKYEKMCVTMGTGHSENDEKEFQKITEEMDRLKAWDYEHDIKSILNELEIDDLSERMKNLSGGMIKKVALAHCLIGNSNLLIMDEPTNHLDLKTIMFLEEHLKNSDKALLMVTHDRYFLDLICDRIIEIDRKTVFKYEGNYSYYLEKKSEIENSLMKDDDRIENLLRKELEWYKRQPKARTTKSRSRMDSIDELMKHEKFTGESDVEMTISGRRLGKKILEINGISKSFGNNRIINSFSYVFKQNEKIGIIGPNGSGKTTFLNLITGNLKPDDGVIDTGINTAFGYITQTWKDIDPGMKIIEYVKKSADLIRLDNGKTITAEKMLERFLFPPNVHYTSIGNLSGGEKRRLYLLNMLMKDPNFLILDEPTNDLDIKTLSVLENFLLNFNGCLIVVTHDRYFMNRVIDHLLVFDGNGNIESFPGNYSDYLDYLESETNKVSGEKPAEKKAANEDKNTPKEKTKLSFKEKKELEETEKKIDLLEKEKKSLDEKFSGNSLDHEKIPEMTKRYDAIEKELDELIKRWEYLANFNS
jgi:ABC transport system ATP-binding/permease protein